MTTAGFPARTLTVSLRLALLLSVTGGLLDAFSYVALGGVFVNAQTGNVVLLAVQAAAGHWPAALRHVWPLLAYVAGLTVAELLRGGRARRQRALWRPARIALITECGLILIAAALGDHVPRTVTVCLLSFAVALQWSVFRALGPIVYASTLVGLNLRTMLDALYTAWFEHDREAARHAVLYGLATVAFILGAGAGGVLTLHLHRAALWVALAPLLLALAAYAVDDRVSRARPAPRSSPPAAPPRGPTG